MQVQILRRLRCDLGPENLADVDGHEHGLSGGDHSTHSAPEMVASTHPRHVLSRGWKEESEFATENMRRADLAHRRAMSNYMPPKLNSAIVAIIAEKEISNTSMLPGPWRLRARVVREATVPGDHLGCITIEVEALAKRIGAFLAGS